MQFLILSDAAAALRDGGHEVTEFEFEPLKPTSNVFRLVQLLPAADFHADVVCEIFESDLTDHPNYEGLSYVWGDATTKVSIWVQQNILWVTENLAKALRYLRKPTEPRCLWVDALCIDQSSNEEKSKQVPLMRGIYSHCTSDLIWLGEAQADTELAISTLQQLQSLEVQRDNDNMELFKNRLAIRDLSYKQVDALSDLLVYPALWQRVWVMQEISCCPRAEIILGHFSMPWDLVSSILDHTHIPDFYHRAYGHHSHAKEVWELFTKTQVISHQRDVIQGIIPHKKQSLLDVLSRFRAASSSDPRDKVYGLLGLASHDFGVKPDYNKSLGEVYADVVLTAIDLGGDLDMICQSQWPIGAADVRRPDLPSWIPDFSYTQEVNIMFAQRDIFSAGDSKCTDSTVIPGGRLMVRAITIGELMPLKPVIATDRNDHWETASDGDIFRSWLPDSLLNGDHIYHTGEDAFQAYWRTIMIDCKAYPITRLDDKELMNYAHRFIAWRTATIKPLDPVGRGHPDNASNILDYYGQSAIGSVSQPPLLRRTFEGWRFATTTVDQYYCMVPHESKEGDLVVVLKGAKVPCVIRPVCNDGQSADLNFSLIGTAYIHGFMDGEAREWTMQGKLEEQDIFLT